MGFFSCRIEDFGLITNIGTDKYELRSTVEAKLFNLGCQQNLEGVFNLLTNVVSAFRERYFQGEPRTRTNSTNQSTERDNNDHTSNLNSNGDVVSYSKFRAADYNTYPTIILYSRHEKDGEHYMEFKFYVPIRSTSEKAIRFFSNYKQLEMTIKKAISDFLKDTFLEEFLKLPVPSSKNCSIY